MDKIVIPCSCGCSILVIVEFDAINEDLPQEFWAEFFTSVDPKANRRSRWSAAWRILRGKNPWIHDVCMDPRALADLRDFLNRNLAKSAK